MGYFIAIIVVLLPIIYQAWQYLDQRKQELKDKRFEIYHRLIKELVQPTDSENIYIDRQVAIIYELRNFPEYAEVSIRILNGLNETWSKNQNIEKRLFTEIELTLTYLKGIINPGESNHQ
jgi:hypothetical protein